MFSCSGFSSPVLGSKLPGSKSPIRSKGWRARNRWQSQAHFQQSTETCSPLVYPSEPQLDHSLPGVMDLEEITATSEHAEAVNSKSLSITGIPAVTGTLADTIVQTTDQELKLETPDLKRSQVQPLTQPESAAHSAVGVAASCEELSKQQPSVKEHKILSGTRIVEASIFKAACKEHFDEVSDCNKTVKGLSRYQLYNQYIYIYIYIIKLGRIAGMLNS